MLIKETKFKDLYLIEAEPFVDQRGYFARTYCRNELSKAGINFEVAQISLSFNKQQGTLRGMHFQKEPKVEDKIVQCLKGKIFDVAVDLRENSSTYGKWAAFELDGEKKNMLLVPKGFAHGFQTLTDDAEVQYVMSEFFSPEHSLGFVARISQLLPLTLPM